MLIASGISSNEVFLNHFPNLVNLFSSGSKLPFSSISFVCDLNENKVLEVKGKIFTFTRKKYLNTLEGETKYIIRNKFWRLFAYKALVLDPNNEVVASIRRKIFSFHDRYFVESDKFGSLELKGNILGFDYHIYLNGDEVGHISRKISLRDSFVLSIDDSKIDYMFVVALVIAIDNITDQRSQDASNNSNY